MPTQSDIANQILRGQLLQAYTVKAYVAQERIGNYFSFWDYAIYLSHLIQGLQNQLLIQDYTSGITLAIYNKLGGELGMQYIDGAALDPNAQLPPTVIVINEHGGSGGGGGGSTVISQPIIFSNQTVVTLSNYQSVYAPTYGNNPVIQVFVPDGSGGYAQDEGTSPVRQYVVSGDPTSGISSITITYPVPTSGFIQITGISQ